MPGMWVVGLVGLAGPCVVVGLFVGLIVVVGLFVGFSVSDSSASSSHGNSELVGGGVSPNPGRSGIIWFSFPAMSKKNLTFTIFSPVILASEVGKGFGFSISSSGLRFQIICKEKNC